MPPIKFKGFGDFRHDTIRPCAGNIVRIDGDSAPDIQTQNEPFVPPCGSVGLGIGRAMMPQIAQKDFGAFKDFLYEQGVDFETVFEDLGSLQPSQSDFNPDKIKNYDPKSYKIVREIPLIISNDGYVVDGHHRFLSLKGTNAMPNTAMALRMGLPITDAIATANQFGLSFNKGVDEEIVASTSVDSAIPHAKDTPVVNKNEIAKKKEVE